MTTFPPPYQYRFHAGPYTPPKTRKGQVIHDEWLGDVKVEGYTDSPIRWPATKYLGKMIPILCDGLVRAVIEEAETAVAYYWGVSKYHVDQWKKALGGGGSSSEVFARLALMKHDPGFRQKYGYSA